MPEMTITRGGGTLANAVDITGQETVEGELDSPDDADYYELRPEEDVEAVFWMDTADVEFQLLDSEGNVLATSVEVGGGSGASAGRPAPDVVGPIVKAVRWLLTKGEKYVVKVSPKAGRALGGARRYVLKHRYRKAALRKIRSFVKRRMEAGTTGEFELSGRWTAEGDLEQTYSATLLTPIPAGSRIRRFVDVGIAVEQTKLKLRLDSVKACQDRAEPVEHRIRVVTKVKLPLPDSIPKTIRDLIDDAIATVGDVALASLRFLTGDDDLALTILDTGPNLRPTVTPPIALAVAAGSSATTTLTDFIEDPEAGSDVTFGAGSVSPGLRATLDGPRLTVAATEDAEDGTLKVAATDRNGVCRTFLVRVSVEEAQVRVKPEYADGITERLVYGQTYTSRDLNEFFDNPLDKLIGFGVGEPSRYPQAGYGAPPDLPLHGPYGEGGWYAQMVGEGYGHTQGGPAPRLEVESNYVGGEGSLLPGNRVSVVVTAGYYDDFPGQVTRPGGGPVDNPVGLRFTFIIRAPTLAPGRPLNSEGHCGDGPSPYPCAPAGGGRWCTDLASSSRCFTNLVIPASSTPTGRLSRETLLCGGRPEERDGRKCHDLFRE